MSRTTDWWRGTAATAAAHAPARHRAPVRTAAARAATLGWRQRGCSSPTMADARGHRVRPRAAARVQRRMLGRPRTRLPRRQQRLDVTLDVEEVDRASFPPHCGRRPRRRPGPPRASAGPRRARCCRPSARCASRRKTRPISNTRTRSALRARLWRSTRTRLPSRLERITPAAGDRVQQLDRVGIAGQLVLPAFLDEAEVDGFLVVQRRQRRRTAMRCGALRAAAATSRRQRRRFGSCW